MTAVVLPSTSASAGTGPTPAGAAAVDEFIRAEMAASSIPGAAVAITRGDEVLFVRGYGHDWRGAPVTGGTPFRVASLSKSFTSLAVLQLADAGLLSLDDRVVQHLPEFRLADPRGAGITVRQLLDQTSGLADQALSELDRPQPTSTTEAVASMSSAHLVAAPGTRWNYHNPNYHVAARLVEVLSGERFDDYLHRHVFEPAGRDATSTTTMSTDGVDPLPWTPRSCGLRLRPRW
jgi:CubicO group peptidase (beta-lactamase class C family)